MTGVEAIPATMAQCHNRMQFNKCDDPNHLIDPTKPIGKILKGPNYTPPQLGPILAAGNWLSEPAKVHIDESTVTDRAKLDHCVDHPERSEEHTSELQSLMRISYADFCLKQKNKPHNSTKAPTRQ